MTSSTAAEIGACGSRSDFRSINESETACSLRKKKTGSPPLRRDGTTRDGAWVTELTDLIDFDRWPEHTRVIARRERPHPGAQLSLFDQHEGFRHQIFITDQPEPDIAALELRHRHRAHIENRIRAAKDTGLRNLPCNDVVCNDAWLQLVLIAQDLIAWTQALCFDGALKIAEPKRLRHRVFHAAATSRSHRRPSDRPVPTHLALGHRHRHRVHTPTSSRSPAERRQRQRSPAPRSRHASRTRPAGHADPAHTPQRDEPRRSRPPTRHTTHPFPRPSTTY